MDALNTLAYRLLEEATRELLAPLADPRLAGSRYERYATDPWAHCEDGHVRVLDLVTFQPVRFEPNQQQIEAVEAWLDLDALRKTTAAGAPELPFRNTHEEKSRQIGVTTGLAWALLWVLMYHDAQGFVVHVDGNEVDDGGNASTYDSIFGKIRYMAEHGELGPPDGEETFWPEHIRPGRYLEWRRRPSIIKNRLRPQRYLRGAVQSPDVGRGRHYTHGILDEAARLAWGESVHTSITRAIPEGRFYNSTPHGKGNMFYRLRKERPANYTFLHHHWTRHPVYSTGLHVAGDSPRACPLCAGNARGLRWSANEPYVAHRYPGRPTSPWYDEAIIELTDEQVAQELDIDYEGSLTARVYPEFSAELHVEETRIEYEPTLPLEFDIDYGWGGSATAIHVFQRVARELRVLAEVEVMNGTPETITGELVEVLARRGIPLRALEPRFTRSLRMIGDPAGDARLATGGTLAGEYRKLGWNPQPGPNEMPVTLRAVKRLLLGRPVVLRISGPDCPRLVESFENNRWPTDRTGKVKDEATAPVNDVYNDHMRAFAYYAAATFPPPQVEDVLQQATVGHAPDAIRDAMTRPDPSGRIDPGLGRDTKL